MAKQPGIAPTRRTLQLKHRREGAVRNRHPWIFAGAIDRETGPEDAAFGDLVDGNGAIIASGFYSQFSQIRLRGLANGVAADETLVRERITAAIARRRHLRTDDTNAVRLVHSEGDDLSGIIVDLYGDIAVVQIANRGAERLADAVADELKKHIPLRGIWFENDLPMRDLERLPRESRWVGEGEPRVEIRENGLRFAVDPGEGQKTGFFLDQRENREITRELAGGHEMLNLFSYTGAFSIYAMAGGATATECVDVSAPAIETARHNHDLNGFGENSTYIAADAFQYVRTRAHERRQYGFVVCDPPAFVKSRGDVERAARGYKDINLYSMRLTAPGGYLMTFSCSGHMPLDLFQKIIFSAAIDTGRRVSFVRRLTAGEDHPVSLYCPEGEYLKGFLLRVE
jgi:23S rRNA (cytosine1962-C5)-methyltransferase